MTTTTHPLEPTLRGWVTAEVDPRYTLSTPSGDHLLYRGAVVRFDSHGTNDTGKHRMGKCKRCSTPHHPHGVRGRRPVSVNGFLMLPCPVCRTMVQVTTVEGTYNDAKVCNERCMGATGPSCECSCGGENHGGRWG